MSGAALGLSVVLASFFVASSVAALAARGISSWHRPCLAALAASRLLRARVAPSVLGIALALGVVAPAFLRFEPRNTGEHVTVSLGLLASCALVLLCSSAARVLRELAHTRRLVRAWKSTARRITLDQCPIPAYAIGTVFPVVAMVGVLRPRLFISAALLRRLTGPELSAVVRHEVGHLRARDNLKRLLLSASVDVLSWSRWGRDIEERWNEAAEDAADDHAVVHSTGLRVDLADALLKVARLSGSLDLACPTSALYRGEHVARRVRRLLAPPPSPGWRGTAGTSTFTGLALGLGAGACVVAVTNPAVHAVLETIVQALP